MYSLVDFYLFKWVDGAAFDAGQKEGQTARKVGNIQGKRVVRVQKIL